LKWKKRVPTGRCKEHELVQSEAFSTSFNDSRSCGFGESEGSYGNLRNLEESNVVSDGANNNGDSVSTLEDDYQRVSYFFSPRCLIKRESEIGGLFTFEATSLLTTVFAKVEPVLLARNLKSYINDQSISI